MKARSSNDYINAYQNTNQALQNQAQLNKQYTGNAGYQNALSQGMSGANATAAQAGAQSTQAARNAGMNKTRAAQMGASNAANSYGNNLSTQQALAQNAGNAALSANQALTSGYQGQAGLAQSEQQNVWNRKNQNLDRIAGIVGNVGQGLTSLLSDEHCKDITDQCDHISKLLEDIGTYAYKYKDEAQEKYPNETNDDLNIGPTAQDLEKNPVTAPSVEEDKDGIKHVNTGRLALSAIAAISDLSKRLSELEGDNE